jgi:hypothetical protein
MKTFGILLMSCFFLSCSSERNWQPLFNGENLEGWHVYGAGQDYDGWYIDKGVLVLDPSKRTKARNSNLITDAEFTDFELSLDWMISENGNSGIFWGVLEDTSLYEHPYQTGPEIQILDDNYQEYIDQRGDINRASSLYGLIPPSKIVSKPANAWNSLLLHIDQTNNEGFVIFNGEKVLDFPVNGSGWTDLISGSSFEGWNGFGNYPTGRICLQDHGSQVAFRNIKIRTLN